MYYKKLEKFCKKVLAGLKKGSTFAPAFGRREGSGRGEPGAKFFESLRPAQDQRHWEAARGKEPLTKGTPREHQGGTRDSEKNLSTTILQRRV